MIYVIDDDASICKALARVMKSAGLPVQTFVSAKAFLQSVQPAETDCMVVDIQMPDMTGPELQEQLVHSDIHTPIIFISAFDDEQIRKQTSEHGAAGYFQKPVDNQALLDAIKFAVDRAASIHSTRSTTGRHE